MLKTVSPGKAPRKELTHQRFSQTITPDGATRHPSPLPVVVPAGASSKPGGQHRGVFSNTRGMTMRPWKLEVVSGESGEHWVRFVGANGEITFNSETFPTRSAAVQAADRAARRFGELVTAAICATMEAVVEAPTEGI